MQTPGSIDHGRKKRPMFTDTLPDIADASPSPSQQASQAERDILIQTALDALPADYRMAVVLRYFEGLSGAEMAVAGGNGAQRQDRGAFAGTGESNPEATLEGAVGVGAGRLQWWDDWWQGFAIALTLLRILLTLAASKWQNRRKTVTQSHGSVAGRP